MMQKFQYSEDVEYTTQCPTLRGGNVRSLKSFQVIYFQDIDKPSEPLLTFLFINKIHVLSISNVK